MNDTPSPEAFDVEQPITSEHADEKATAMLGDLTDGRAWASVGLRASGRSALALVVLGLVALVPMNAGAAAHDEGTEVLLWDGEPIGTARAGNVVQTGVLEAPNGFERVGLMWDAPAHVRLEVRLREADSWSDWRPVLVSFEEGVAHVGYADADGRADALDLRARSDSGEAPRISFLRLEFIEEFAPERGAAVRAHVEVQQGAPVNPRDAWGARAPTCINFHTPEKITIHHVYNPTNDTETPEARARQIQDYHMDVRGWCDIGFHFLIARDGSRWQGRDATWIGSHVGTAFNANNIGVAFMSIPHTVEPITPTQIDSAGVLMRWLRDTYEIPANDASVKGHRDYNSETGCPGNALYTQIPDLIAEMAEGDDGGGGCAVGAGQEAHGSITSLGLLAAALVMMRRRRH